MLFLLHPPEQPRRADHVADQEERVQLRVDRGVGRVRAVPDRAAVRPLRRRARSGGSSGGRGSRPRRRAIARGGGETRHLRDRGGLGRVLQQPGQHEDLRAGRDAGHNRRADDGTGRVLDDDFDDLLDNVDLDDDDLDNGSSS